MRFLGLHCGVAGCAVWTLQHMAVLKCFFLPASHAQFSACHRGCDWMTTNYLFEALAPKRNPCSQTEPLWAALVLCKRLRNLQMWIPKAACHPTWQSIALHCEWVVPCVSRRVSGCANQDQFILWVSPASLLEWKFHVPLSTASKQDKSPKTLTFIFWKLSFSALCAMKLPHKQAGTERTGVPLSYT